MANNYSISNINLAGEGRKLIQWAEDHMPVVGDIKKDFIRSTPLKGAIVGCCLHVTKETAVLVKTLQAGGATVGLCGSNPLSTNDMVAAALAKEGIHVYAWRGNHEKYYWCVDKVLELKPSITMDDGGVLVTSLHTHHQDLIQAITPR